MRNIPALLLIAQIKSNNPKKVLNLSNSLADDRVVSGQLLMLRRDWAARASRPANVARSRHSAEFS